MIAELSSYQLELCRNLKSDVSVYLNLAPDHLNRYNGFEQYGRVKWNIAGIVKPGGLFLIDTRLMPANTNLWKGDHPIDTQLKSLHSHIMEIDTLKLNSENFKVINSSFQYNNLKLLDCSELNIQGKHNYSNILFSLEIIRYLNEPETTCIKQGLKSFKSLPHRYEKISSTDGNTYINDSKATTTQASIIAIKNSDEPLYLYLGGRSKGEDYSELANVVASKKARVFLYGENRFELEKALEQNNVMNIYINENLEEAFFTSQKVSQEEGDRKITFLLSPASTSWDQYSSFEERGNHFRLLVEGI